MKFHSRLPSRVNHSIKVSLYDKIYRCCSRIFKLLGKEDARESFLKGHGFFYIIAREPDYSEDSHGTLVYEPNTVLRSHFCFTYT